MFLGVNAVSAEFVSLQIDVVRVRSFTAIDCTFMRLFSRVNALVRSQYVQSTKTLITYVAVVRFVAGVAIHVLSQVIQLAKTRSAVIAYWN